jgi:uncharacterized protein YbjT (DUF2867 family)
MTGLIKPVAVDGLAATVAELATGAPVGGRVELGGPEALGIDTWARRLFAVTGDARGRSSLTRRRATSAPSCTAAS